MKTIVALLIVAVAYTQTHPRVPSTISVNPEAENLVVSDNGEQLWEGDMILNKEQIEYFTSPLDMRKARKGDKYRWTNGRVPYTISESSENYKNVIQEAMQHWMNYTCITFVKVAPGAQEPHLIFRQRNGCNSAVGMQAQNGQYISIGKGCGSIGTVIHEIGHAIGFYHEQARPDRDQFVVYIDENVKEGYKFAYKIHENIETYGVPYDLTSIMHYGLWDFNSNGKSTMVPVDIHKTFLIGRKKKLSFYDRKLANLMYNCSANCRNPPSCSNDGYVDHNCHCQCRDGFSGKLCETEVKGVEPCGGTFTRPTTIKTPNYPNYYPEGNCIWLFKAPVGKKVQASFTAFDLIYRKKAKNECLWDYLEIRTKNLKEGNFYCGNEMENKSNTSEGNEMALLFKAVYGDNKGFKAEITFV